MKWILLLFALLLTVSSGISYFELISNLSTAFFPLFCLEDMLIQLLALTYTQGKVLTVFVF